MSKSVTSILAGLGGMFGWGISDFLANQSSEKLGYLKTFFWSQVVGLFTIGIAAIIFQGVFTPNITTLALILIAGVAYALGYLFFYKGFEIGNVSVISAVYNVQTLFVILVSFFVFHQVLTNFQIMGLGLLVLGIILVSVKFADLKKSKVTLLSGVKETLVATVFFGILVWPTTEYVVERIPWPMVAFLIKLISILTVFTIARLRKTSLQLGKVKNKLLFFLIFIGFLEAVAIISTNIGLTYGDAILVAPISSALTIVTVSLAVIFLKEKISQQQGIGIALTIIGIILTAF